MKKRRGGKDLPTFIFYRHRTVLCFLFSYGRFFLCIWLTSFLCAELDVEWSLVKKVMLFGVIIGAVAVYMRLSKKSTRDKAAALEKTAV